jgi:hypothetical protein
MAILTTSGRIDFGQEIDPSLLPAHLAECLRSVDADEVEIANNRVTFEGGVFRFVTNWNALAPFGFGDLTVDSEARAVAYGLSYRQLVILNAILVGLSACLILALGGVRGLPKAILTLLLFVSVAGFINLAIRISNFERFLRRCIATAPNLKGMVKLDSCR